MLALYPRSELAKDSNLADAPAGSLEFSPGYLAESKEEVWGQAAPSFCALMTTRRPRKGFGPADSDGVEWRCFPLPQTRHA